MSFTLFTVRNIDGLAFTYHSERFNTGKRGHLKTIDKIAGPGMGGLADEGEERAHLSALAGRPLERPLVSPGERAEKPITDV